MASDKFQLRGVQKNLLNQRKKVRTGSFWDT
jgi:hypothetical protein